MPLFWRWCSLCRMPLRMAAHFHMFLWLPPWCWRCWLLTLAAWVTCWWLWSAKDGSGSVLVEQQVGMGMWKWMHFQQGATNSSNFMTLEFITGPERFLSVIFGVPLTGTGVHLCFRVAYIGRPPWINNKTHRTEWTQATECRYILFLTSCSTVQKQILEPQISYFPNRAEICSAGVDRWANPNCIHLGGTQRCTDDVDVDLAGSAAGRCATRRTERHWEVGRLMVVNSSSRCMCCRKALF